MEWRERELDRQLLATSIGIAALDWLMYKFDHISSHFTHALHLAQFHPNPP